MARLIRPFRALRPRAETAADVVAPPYDVVDTEEARALAANRPASFLRISRPEIEFPPEIDAHDDAVYARGRENLARLVRDAVLVRDERPSFYLYRMRMAEHVQTGLALTASVRAYERNRVRKHERTKPDKEQDRVRNIETLRAQTGPVLTAYRNTAAISTLLARAAERRPLYTVLGPHEVEHTLWQIDDASLVAELGDAFEELDALYIADGHHRSAAAARVAAHRRAAGASEGSHEYFLSVAFPSEELKIFDYNRTLATLNGHDAGSLLSAVAERFELETLGRATAPRRRGEFSMYVAGRWYRLGLDPSLRPADPVARLDVSVLQDRLIEPVLGVSDPRTDPRIDFVGGIRGLDELERRVDAGRAAIAFALYPTSMHELMAVADAERLMPPKSTWFEPKLADGLLSHVLD